MKKFDWEEHLKKEHKQTVISKYLREIVYGGNDGIVTTFAVVAGFAGAQTDPSMTVVPIVSVLLFGLANLFADGLSMSLGSFLSLRADQDVYRNEKAKELHEITHTTETEFTETVEILKRKHFSPEDAKAVAKLYMKNSTYWVQFMMDDELEMSNPEKEKSFSVAVSTFVAFVGFGFIPLLPYALGIDIRSVFSFSIVFTAVALLLLGLLRASATQQKPFRGILETLFVGGVSASVAYFVGTFFRL